MIKIDGKSYNTGNGTFEEHIVSERSSFIQFAGVLRYNFPLRDGTQAVLDLFRKAMPDLDIYPDMPKLTHHNGIPIDDTKHPTDDTKHPIDDLLDDIKTLYNAATIARKAQDDPMFRAIAGLVGRLIRNKITGGN